MYDLVEELISDRAFGRAAGVYLDAGAELEDLVYAARRLLQAGQKVVLLDWDVTRGAGEELLSSEIPVIDIHLGDEDQVEDGRAELVVHQGADDLDWTMTVTRAGELMKKLEGVDVIVFLGEDTATGELQLEEDTVAMSASTVGGLAGAWGASILVATAQARIYQVLASQLEMTWQELN
jgi:acetoin utilization deacetylase AcuC-like enzyme